MAEECGDLTFGVPCFFFFFAPSSSLSFFSRGTIGTCHSEVYNSDTDPHWYFLLFDRKSRTHNHYLILD